MKTWIPINKATGVEYQTVDDAGKAAYESDPELKGKYRFREVATKAIPKHEPKKSAPVEPIEAKRVSDVTPEGE